MGEGASDTARVCLISVQSVAQVAWLLPITVKPVRWAMAEFELVWDSRCGVAESPVWDASNRRLLFCDIPGKRINVLSVDDGAQSCWDFPEVVGSFGLCLSGRMV